ncbi:MAG: tetratricopeptide repeat protein, partial [Fimbriimonadales bacterium]|nr:tetratricopeptide repeat protein [Fimbriimonadales bacterium]
GATMRNLWIAVGLIGLMASALAQAKPPHETRQKLDAIRDLIQYRLVQLGDHYWHEGHHYKTMALLFVLIEYDPQDVEGYAVLGWLLDSYGHTSRAFQVYERGIRANPDRYDLYFEAGFWYSQKGEYQKARAYLEKAVSFKNAPIIVWKALAHTCERMGDLKRSLEAWQKAKQLDPNDGAVDRNMARVRRKLEEQREKGRSGQG